ncbi:MAG: HAD-IA family hydrolase [Chitinophagales bacterium]|nr:HAD-IA family hydrolase [Chitinophagales bacterium]
MQEIEAIVFDLGNVVLPLEDMNVWHDKVRDLFEYKNQYDYLVGKKFFLQFEAGLFDSDFFISTIENHANIHVTKKHILETWNFVLKELPVHRVNFLLKLKKRYRLFLLSNTNSLHIEYFLDKVNTLYGKNIMNEIFEHCYYSYEIKMLKPDTEIYTHVLKQQNLFPTKTLFLDDRADNIAGAKQLGIQTILVDPKDDITQILKNY